MPDVNLSDILGGGSATGGGYDAVAFQMIEQAVSEAAIDAGFALADRREVFDRLVFNLDGVTVAQKTAALAFDNATDAAAIAASAKLVDVFNASGYVLDLAKAGTESAAFMTGSTGDPATGTFTQNFSVSVQDTIPQEVCFHPDGTKMYVAGDVNAELYQYTLSTPWDISTASYASKLLSVGAQGGAPYGLYFKPDGLAVYVLDVSNQGVFQYTLSTAWDVSTGTYASKTFSVASEEITPAGLFFKPDGTKMYVVGWSNSNVLEYDLSTPWDVSTASYTGKSFNVSANAAVPRSLVISDDGVRLFVIGSGADAVAEYTLSTPWDISTASYASKLLSVSAQEINPSGMAFGAGGTKLFVVGTTGDDVNEYAVTAYPELFVHTPA